MAGNKGVKMGSPIFIPSLQVTILVVFSNHFPGGGGDGRRGGGGGSRVLLLLLMLMLMLMLMVDGCFRGLGCCFSVGAKFMKLFFPSGGSDVDRRGSRQ